MTIHTWCEHCHEKIDITAMFGPWWKYLLSLFRPHICNRKRYNEVQAWKRQYAEECRQAREWLKIEDRLDPTRRNVLR